MNVYAAAVATATEAALLSSTPFRMRDLPLSSVKLSKKKAKKVRKLLLKVARDLVGRGVCCVLRL